jgi:prevent-host-death family protein
MRRIPAGQFKAKCLSLMDEVQQTGEEIIITKRGQPVARLLPPVTEKPRRIWGCKEGTVEILGDIVASTEEEWDAEK